MDKLKNILTNKFIIIDKNYKCLYCNIIIKHKTSILKHIESNQHQNNEKTTFICVDCEFTSKSEKIYNNHLVSKTHKKNGLDNIICQKNIKIQKDKQSTNNFNKVAESLKKDIINEIKNEIKNEMNKNKITREEVKQIVKEGVDESKFAKSTSAVLNKLKNNFPGNPPLMCLNDYSSQILLSQKFNTKLSSDNYAVEKALILSYKHKKLVMELVNLLLSQIKHEDKTKQGVFVSDISRLTYLVKITVKDWLNDKRGLKFAEKVIQPLLDTIKSRLRDFHNYFVDKGEDDVDDVDDIEHYEFYQENYTYISNLIKNINNETLCQEILNKITPHLQYQDNIILEIDNYDENK